MPNWLPKNLPEIAKMCVNFEGNMHFSSEKICEIGVNQNAAIKNCIQEESPVQGNACKDHLVSYEIKLTTGQLQASYIDSVFLSQ